MILHWTLLIPLFLYAIVLNVSPLFHTITGEKTESNPSNTQTNIQTPLFLSLSLSLSLPSTRLLVPLLARSSQCYCSLLFLILSLSLPLSFVSHDGGSHARDSPDGPSFSLQPLLLSTCGEEERILLDAIAQTKCVLL